MPDHLAPPLPAGLQPRADPPSFSVIIAVHDGASTIGDALGSALEQDRRPHEVVVCDDGSTDDLEAALAPFAGSIRLVRQARGGEAAAKNAAARAATGEFVVILDADDVFLPGRLAALADLAMARPDLDLLTTDAHFEVDGVHVARCYHDTFTFEVDDQRREILRRNFVFGLAAIRRDRFLDVGGFSSDVSHSADWDCWIRLILSGTKAGLVTAPLAVYRLHQGSMNADRLAMYRGRRTTLQRALANPHATEAERAVVRTTLEREDRRIDRESLDVALADGDGVRPLATRVARDAGHPLRARVKAAAAVLAPPLARAVVRRRRARYWTAAGDLRLPRT